MRYVATIQFYIHADNDQEALNLAKSMSDEQRTKNDNDCSLISVVEQQFGTIGNRAIFDIED